MKVKMTVDDKEIKKLIKKLQKYEKETLDKVEHRIMAGGLKIQREARTDILVDTGRARAATVVSWVKDGGRVMGAVVRTDVNYAIYIERRKPYLYKAFAKEQVLLIRDLKALIRK